jgi:hypothetical protein
MAPSAPSANGASSFHLAGRADRPWLRAEAVLEVTEPDRRLVTSPCRLVRGQRDAPAHCFRNRRTRVDQHHWGYAEGGELGPTVAPATGNATPGPLAVG